MPVDPSLIARPLQRLNYWESGIWKAELSPRFSNKDLYRGKVGLTFLLRCREGHVRMRGHAEPRQGCEGERVEHALTGPPAADGWP
jgi:hypothetical protein